MAPVRAEKKKSIFFIFCSAAIDSAKMAPVRAEKKNRLFQKSKFGFCEKIAF